VAVNYKFIKREARRGSDSYGTRIILKELGCRDDLVLLLLTVAAIICVL